MRATPIAGCALAALSARATAEPDPAIDRPLTLDARSIAAIVDLYASHRSVTIGGITAASTSEAARVAVGYGITDTVEVGLELAFSLHHFQTDQPLTVSGSVALIHTPTLDVGVTAGLVIAHDPGSRVELGVGARYKLGAEVAVVAGGSGIASKHALVGTGLGPIAPTALGRQLAIGVRSGSASSLDLPLGVAVQATPWLELGLGTSVGHIAIAHDASAYTIPVELAALVAVRRGFDVTAFVDVPDLRTEQLELVFFGLGARYVHP